eukprot:3207447-Prorocentrum_lima.AAC.1
MIESRRPEHQLNSDELTFDEEGRICGDTGKRICTRCELDLRWEEWPDMEEKERAYNPNYCIWEQ